jgi:hypothetical protein
MLLALSINIRQGWKEVTDIENLRRLDTQHNAFSITILSKITLSIITLSIMTLIIITFSIITLSIITLNIMTLSIPTNEKQHSA